MQRRVAIGMAILAATASWACEPASVTEAREQLQRGGTRVVEFSIPVAAETLTVDTLLKDLEVDVDTLAGGLLGFSIDPETLSVAVGEKLRFDNLGFDQFTFSFDQMLETQEVSTGISLGISGPAPAGAGPAGAPQQTGDIEFTTPNGSQVTFAAVDTVWVVRQQTNLTLCDAYTRMALVDADNDTLVFFDSTVVLSNDTLTDSVKVNGIFVDGFINVEIEGGTTDLICFPGIGATIGGGVTFRPARLDSVGLQNVNEGFNETFDALASETRIQAVDTVVVDSGGFVLSVQNRLPIAENFDLTFTGIERPPGTPLTATLNVPAAPGDGSTVTGTLNLDLADATITPSLVVVSVSGSAVAPSATISPAVANNAVVVDGSGSLRIRSLKGTLDPDSTPELKISIEESTEIPLANLDLGDFEDVVKDATLNSVQISLFVDNQADVPVTLDSFRLGAVRIDTLTGQPERDVNGELVFEIDSTTGLPLLIDTTLALNRAGTTTILLDDQETAGLINRVVDLLLDSVRVALVGSGDAVVGDGSQAGITNADSVSLAIGLSVGVDFTLPITGVTFETNTVQEGLNSDTTFSDEEIDDLTGILDTAFVTLEIQNGTPFEVEAVVAVVDDSLADSVDVFQQPNRITLDTVSVGAPQVDSTGLVLQPASSRVTVDLSGDEVKVFLSQYFTAGIKVTLRPPAGGRGALRGSDQVIVEAEAGVKFRLGGSQ